MADFIVNSDEDEQERAQRHRRDAQKQKKKKRPSAAAYNPDLEDSEEILSDGVLELEDEEEEEEEFERKRSRKGRKGGRPPKPAARRPSEEDAEENANEGGRLRRLRKAPSETVVLNLESEDENEVLDVEIYQQDDVPTLNEEKGESEEEGEEESEEEDDETIAALDSIINQTEQHTVCFRQRLDKLPIDEKKSKMVPTEGAPYEVAPACLRHQLKDYQLVGLNWMYLLHQEGLNGILADESTPNFVLFLSPRSLVCSVCSGAWENDSEHFSSCTCF